MIKRIPSNVLTSLFIISFSLLILYYIIPIPTDRWTEKYSTWTCSYSKIYSSQPKVQIYKRGPESSLVVGWREDVLYVNVMLHKMVVLFSFLFVVSVLGMNVWPLVTLPILCTTCYHCSSFEFPNVIAWK